MPLLNNLSHGEACDFCITKNQGLYTSFFGQNIIILLVKLNIKQNWFESNHINCLSQKLD
jgi:hypothetical protein